MCFNFSLLFSINFACKFPLFFLVSQYGIVLDAGSSHTSLFIYKWPADKQNGTGVVTQHGECHAEGKYQRLGL